jgi:hypothetical protein
MLRTFHIIVLLAAVGIMACGGEQDTPAAAAAGNAGQDPLVAADAVPPVDIAYQVLGNPVVGSPVAVNLQVSSAVARVPVVLSYRVNDATSMTFPGAQASRVELVTAGPGEDNLQQVTVIPQREGRLYLNVTAEIRTDGGAALKSIAVPILVDAAAQTGDARSDEIQGDEEQGAAAPDSETR